jgi:integrase
MATANTNTVIKFPIQALQEGSKGGRPKAAIKRTKEAYESLTNTERSKKALDALSVKNAKYDHEKGGKQKLSDQFGLFLELSPAGGKVWRLKYSFGGKSKDLTIGKYPLFSLTDARQARDEAKKELANGNDPGVLKKQAKGYDGLLDDAFMPYAQKWVNNSGGRDTAWSQSTSVRILSRLNRFVFKDSQLGNQAIGSITTLQLVNLLQECKKASTKDVAYRLQQDLISIFNQAARHSLCPKGNPAAYLQKEIRKPKGGNFPSITDPKRVGEVLQIIYTTHPTVKPQYRTLMALRLMPYLFGRNAEIRSMEWSEIDWDKNHWVIPAHKMKMRKVHGVPLTRQAMAILKELKENAPESKLVFFGYRVKSQTLSNMTINNCMKDLGISPKEITPHGFRAMAQTLATERLKIAKHIIDLQLSHRPADDKYNGAYDRAEFWEDRVGAMQKYADYLDQLRAAA